MSTAREATTRLADLLRREHCALADFLVALAAFHRERRWLELGYSSLFIFLVRELGLSKGAAFYRNRAAELIGKFPEIVAPLRDGRLCLSSVAELSAVLTAENSRDVLPRYFHLSRSEAKEVTAALKPDPAPPLRTVVTQAPPGDAPAVCNRSANHAPRADPGTGQPGFLGNLARASSAVPDVAPSPATQRPARADVQPLTAELTRLHVTVPRRLLEKLAAARDALSHSHPRASDDEILELGLDLIVDRHRKRRGIGAKPRKTHGPRREAEVARENLAERPETPARPAKAATTAATAPAMAEAPVPPPPPPARSRHVPAAVWRAVWERDQGRCVWPVDGGGVCGSTRRLQLDHVEGWALGAETTAEACRLLCALHNDLHAREMYGDAVMDGYTKGERGGCCSEAVADYITRDVRAVVTMGNDATPRRRRCVQARSQSPPDRPQSVGYGYDQQGNLSSIGTDWINGAFRGGICLRHDVMGRLALVGPGNNNGPDSTSCYSDGALTSVSARFVYDAQNRRVARWSAATGDWTYFVHGPGGELLSELRKTGDAAQPWAPVRDYVWLDGRPVAQVEYVGTTARPYYVHADHLGTPRKLTSPERTVVWSAAMQPYGEVEETTTPDPVTGRTVVTNLRLPGQYDERLLGSIGLQGPYYNWNRWYLPSMGRYMELDPLALGGTFNTPVGVDWYGYALGNPIRFSDPTGLCSVVCSRDPHVPVPAQWLCFKVSDEQEQCPWYNPKKYMYFRDYLGFFWGNLPANMVYVGTCANWDADHFGLHENQGGWPWAGGIGPPNGDPKSL